ncbi:3-deoxy-manno-octulosonate-8-phosphatase KdsC [Pseudidiomarina taiwanensis]|uniref:3-deoxy-D-manno-octulosonate 8-phosphate phosphatase KdsC n=1 Tax=Pseudidiomarina taiwanensis TaxID=337250 RepID=A0A432ZKZ2_9GAMM|nr:3-deoxy-manno-octulosonate-8-phosphatase KdsC [Pseudidiomarina taiwanensis]RUO78564.1 3-deoxy-manno-octulosonate-8-phosphatase KdsC [Pseudidiomarina taiwanensis]
MNHAPARQQFENWYQAVDDSVWQAATQIKLLICDVDGVFSDGRIYLGNQGEELKTFHTRDGFGVKALLGAGVQVAVITGRNSRIVNDRMQALGVTDIIQGQEHKHIGYAELQQKYQLEDAAIACVGDDIPDLAMLKAAGLACAPADAHPQVRAKSAYVTQTRGGYGVVRELSDLILLSQGKAKQEGGVSL